MSTTRNSSPAWLPHFISAMATIAATWACIRTEVPAIVQAEVNAELATHRTTMVHHVDSLWSTVDTTLQQRIEERATKATDDVLAYMGLLSKREPGQPPHITVLPDTTGRRYMLSRMDSLLAQQREVDRALALIYTRMDKWDRTPNRRGKD